MDGGGRLAQPLKRSPRPRRGRTAAALWLKLRPQFPAFIRRFVRRYLAPRSEQQPGLPRGLGIAAVTVFMLASLGYGAVKGDHLPVIVAQARDARDALANAVGFRIDKLSVNGRRQLGKQDVLAIAGVTQRTSLLFLDVDDVRARLEASPWIAQATVRKFLPGRLQIDIDERVPFALWQKDGQISVIAADGAVLSALDDRRFTTLPLVVGPGAEKRAKDFLALLDLHPAIRDQVRASILVADRRWNLKLKNGIDIRLPEENVAGGLDTLSALDRDKKMLTRDITAVDLRLPDRVTVRLSDEAAQAREEALKPKKQKGKGGNA